MYVHNHVCVYLYMYVYMYTNVYLHMCECMHLPFVMCMCICLCIYVNVCIYVWYICVYVYLCVCIYVYVYIFMCAYVCIDIYTHTKFFIRFAVMYGTYLLTFHSSLPNYNSICWCWAARRYVYFELTQEEFLLFSQNTFVYLFVYFIRIRPACYPAIMTCFQSPKFIFFLLAQTANIITIKMLC